MRGLHTGDGSTASGSLCTLVLCSSMLWPFWLRCEPYRCAGSQQYNIGEWRLYRGYWWDGKVARHQEYVESDGRCREVPFILGGFTVLDGVLLL